MSNERNQEHPQSETKPKARREMTRRQFLSYTLGGTGAFMLSLPVIPMLRFTVDPLLQEEQGTEFVKVIEENKVTTEPQSVEFNVHVVDGWYEHKPKFQAWVARDDKGEIYALSPICKHLGCLVNWDSDPRYPNQFFCPCHEAHYSKDGKNLAVAPSPLDEYEVKVDNGWVYLGALKPNSRT